MLEFPVFFFLLHCSKTFVISQIYIKLTHHRRLMLPNMQDLGNNDIMGMGDFKNLKQRY